MENKYIVITDIFELSEDYKHARCAYCGKQAKYNKKFMGYDKEEWFTCNCVKINVLTNLQNEKERLTKELQTVEKQLQSLSEEKCKDLKVKSVLDKVHYLGLKVTDLL